MKYCLKLANVHKLIKVRGRSYRCLWGKSASILDWLPLLGSYLKFIVGKHQQNQRHNIFMPLM